MIGNISYTGTMPEFHSRDLVRAIMMLFHCQRTKVKKVKTYTSVKLDTTHWNTCSSLAFLIPFTAELSPHTVADAFYNGEMENEIRLLVTEKMKLEDIFLKSDGDRETIMERIECIRSQSIYHHHYCAPDCRKRGRNFDDGRGLSMLLNYNSTQAVHMLNDLPLRLCMHRVRHLVGYRWHLEADIPTLYAQSQGKHNSFTTAQLSNYTFLI